MGSQPRELQPNDISLRYLLYESSGIAFFEALFINYPITALIRTCTYKMSNYYIYMYIRSWQSGILISPTRLNMRIIYANINAKNFDSWLGLSVNKLDWWTIWLTLLLLSPKQLRNSAIAQSHTSMLTSVVKVSCLRMFIQSLPSSSIAEFLYCSGDSFTFRI